MKKKREVMQKINECDIISPNGGLTFTDVSGMGNIEFPDEKTANEYIWPYPEILGPKGEMTNQPNERISVYWLKSRVS